MQYKKEPLEITDSGNIVPLNSYSESIGADASLLKRQASRYGAIINRGGVNFIDLDAFDSGQVEEATSKRKTKEERKEKGKGSTGSVATTNSTGLLRGLINKLNKSIPVKERELADLEAEYDNASNQVVKSALSRRYDRLEPELRKNKKTLELAQKRLDELAKQDCQKFEDGQRNRQTKPKTSQKEK